MPPCGFKWIWEFNILKMERELQGIISALLFAHTMLFLLEGTLSWLALGESLHQPSPSGMRAPHAFPSSLTLVPSGCNSTFKQPTGWQMWTGQAGPLKWQKFTRDCTSGDFPYWNQPIGMMGNKRKRRLGQVETNRRRDRCLQHLAETGGEGWGRRGSL